MFGSDSPVIMTSATLATSSETPAKLADPPPRSSRTQSNAPSKNPSVRALEYANSIGCRTLALTGRGGGKLGPLAQLALQVGETHTGRIEDAHMAICHMISYYFMESK